MTVHACYSTVEPGYNDFGLYDTSSITSEFCGTNTSLLTVTSYSPVITTSLYAIPRV